MVIQKTSYTGGCHATNLSLAVYDSRGRYLPATQSTAKACLAIASSAWELVLIAENSNGVRMHPRYVDKDGSLIYLARADRVRSTASLPSWGRFIPWPTMSQWLDTIFVPVAWSGGLSQYPVSWCTRSVYRICTPFYIWISETDQIGRLNRFMPPQPGVCP